LIQCLDTVGVPSSVLTRKPSQLSGGELQRIALARIMVLNPSVVVLGEPTAMLDVLTQARIMDLLARIQRKTGMSYVLISHDEALVQSVCTTRFRLENSHLIGVSGPAPG
jgi:peptide/nickel transport system ATP-binding protein